jgi:hypothetical protein
MLDHINKIKSMSQHLEAIGEKLEKSDVVMVLLCNLPKFYNNLIVALKSQVDANLSIEFIITRLLHDELKRKDAKGSNEGRSTLLVCTSKAMSSNSTIDQKLTIKKDQKKNLCNYYKKLGHWA